MTVASVDVLDETSDRLEAHVGQADVVADGAEVVKSLRCRRKNDLVGFDGLAVLAAEGDVGEGASDLPDPRHQLLR